MSDKSAKERQTTADVNRDDFIDEIMSSMSSHVEYLSVDFQHGEPEVNQFKSYHFLYLKYAYRYLIPLKLSNRKLWK